MPNSNYQLLKIRLRDSLNRNLSRKGWTLKTLSDKSGVPYETLKKLANAKINNPSLQSTVKIAEAFGCSLDSLLMDEAPLVEKLYSLSPRSLKFIEAIADFELALTIREKACGECLLPVVSPTGYMEDGMIFDTLNTEYMDAAPYLSQFGPQILYFLKITGDTFSPTYAQGDLLLISREKQPSFGSVCIFLHHNQLYIRSYIPGSPPRLDPVNQKGSSVFMDTPESWTFGGCVLTTIRRD